MEQSTSTQLPDIIELELKAKHFEGTHFTFKGHCAIEKSLMELFPNYDVHEFIHDLAIGDFNYIHTSYYSDLFTTDQLRASTLPPETVIRTITLTKQ